MKLKLPEDHPYKDGRTCTTCKTFKLSDQFTLARDKRSFGGISMRSKCKSCDEYRKYKRSIIGRYGIDYKQYQEILKKQNFKCAVCGVKTSQNKRTSGKLFIDHCHVSNKVRGLLCSKCNQGLGLFNDDPDILTKAIQYLIYDQENNVS